jgi:hypothetical protein
LPPHFDLFAGFFQQAVLYLGHCDLCISQFGNLSGALKIEIPTNRLDGTRFVERIKMQSRNAKLN